MAKTYKFFNLKSEIFICNMTVNHQIFSFLHWSRAMHFRINWGLVKVRYIFPDLNSTWALLTALNGNWSLIFGKLQTHSQPKQNLTFNPSQTISKKHKRNWVFATTSIFQISLSLQPGSVTLSYFKLRIFNPIKCKVWQI